MINKIDPKLNPSPLGAGLSVQPSSQQQGDSNLKFLKYYY